MVNEKWKDIKGYEGQYQVSNLGRVRSIDCIREFQGRWGKTMRRHKGIVKKLKRLSNGYFVVGLGHSSTALVARLVASAFIRQPLVNEEVNHKDGIKAHNSVDNLEWVTKSENQRHRYDTLRAMPDRQIVGLLAYQRERAKPIDEKLSESLLRSDLLLKEIRDITGVSIATISRRRRALQ